MGPPRRVALGQQPRVEITLPKISHVPLREPPPLWNYTVYGTLGLH